MSCNYTYGPIYLPCSHKGERTLPTLPPPTAGGGRALGSHPTHPELRQLSPVSVKAVHTWTTGKRGCFSFLCGFVFPAVIAFFSPFASSPTSLLLTEPQRLGWASGSLRVPTSQVLFSVLFLPPPDLQSGMAAPHLCPSPVPSLLALPSLPYWNPGFGFVFLSYFFPLLHLLPSDETLPPSFLRNGACKSSF